MRDEYDELMLTPNPESQAIWDDLIDNVFAFLAPVPREMLRSATGTMLQEDSITIVTDDLVVLGLIEDYHDLITEYLAERGRNMELVFYPGEDVENVDENLFMMDLVNKGRRGHLRAV